MLSDSVPHLQWSAEGRVTDSPGVTSPGEEQWSEGCHLFYGGNWRSPGGVMERGGRTQQP